MTATQNTHPTIDGRQFRHVVGHLASGVTIITTANEDGRFGLTASSVTSLSADPAMMLVCLNNSSPSSNEVARAGKYAINVLGERHSELAYRFASPSADKFAGIAVSAGLTGVPLLDDALARIECEVVDRIVGGTHTIFVGRVIAADAADGQPLTYFRGGFGRFAQARDEAVYRTVRGLVLTRHYQPKDTVTVAEIAVSLEAEEPSVFYALTRLVGDGLVRRDLDGGYLVLPFDVSSSDATFDARLVIELGVIEQVAGSAPQEDLAELRRSFEKMAAFLVDDHFVDFDSYLDANYTFHEGLVSLAKNPLLTSVFEGLAIKQVMTRSFGATSETSQHFIDVQGQILSAVEAGDKDAAQDAARTYSSIAKARAREVLALSGGAV